VWTHKSEGVHQHSRRALVLAGAVESAHLRRDAISSSEWQRQASTLLHASSFCFSLPKFYFRIG
jgi:hypothetical protein